MNLESIKLIPAETDRHFAAIAELMNTQETEPNSAATLREWYDKHLEDGIWFSVAICEDGEVPGFSGIYLASLTRERYYHTYLIVGETWRRHGLGSKLYEDLFSKVVSLGAKTLGARVRDTSEAGLRFAEQRGFSVMKHSIEMQFDLKSWDARHYEPIIGELQEQGFHFTNMAELGDTAEARRKLFTLNNEAAATDPGSNGIPPWASFEEFNRDVCESTWYHPDCQILAIDSKTGEWAAMSAITVFEGADHAYNLFTGTDVRYRGRKLAQAVKSLALKSALNLGVEAVRTSHNSENAAMIAIDTKLGYIRTPGILVMEKELG